MESNIPGFPDPSSPEDPSGPEPPFLPDLPNLPSPGAGAPDTTGGVDLPGETGDDQDVPSGGESSFPDVPENEPDLPDGDSNLPGGEVSVPGFPEDDPDLPGLPDMEPSVPSGGDPVPPSVDEPVDLPVIITDPFDPAPPVTVTDPVLPVVRVPDAGLGETITAVPVGRQETPRDTTRERDTERTNGTRNRTGGDLTNPGIPGWAPNILGGESPILDVPGMPVVEPELPGGDSSLPGVEPGVPSPAERVESAANLGIPGAEGITTGVSDGPSDAGFVPGATPGTGSAGPYEAARPEVEAAPVIEVSPEAASIPDFATENSVGQTAPVFEAGSGNDGTSTRAAIGDTVVADTGVGPDADNEAWVEDSAHAYAGSVPSAAMAGRHASSGWAGPVVAPVIVTAPVIPVVVAAGAGTGETVRTAPVDRQIPRSDRKPGRD